MFEIKKTFIISADHQLDLNYESKCKNRHGHNFKISIYCRSTELDKNGMVVDFTIIKKKIEDKLDHTVLNEIEDLGWYCPHPGQDERIRINRNPTAERIAKWICMQIGECYRVDVEEVEGSVATYIDDSVKV